MRVGRVGDLTAVERPDDWVSLYDRNGWFVRLAGVEAVEEWAPWEFRGVEFSGMTSGVECGLVVEQRGRWGLGVVGFKYGAVRMKPGMGVWFDGRLVAIAPIPPQWKRLRRAVAVMQMGGEA